MFFFRFLLFQESPISGVSYFRSLLFQESPISRFSCHLPDRMALDIVHSMHQMQLQQQQLLHGIGSAVPPAVPPQDGSGGEPTTGGGETTTGFVRVCAKCGQKSYFRERCCLNSQCESCLCLYSFHGLVVFFASCP